MFNLKCLILLGLFIESSVGFTICEVQGAKSNDDLLFSLITAQDKCPATVLELKNLFEKDGLKANPSIVANRGFHNPKFGSFSIFETLEGASKSYKKVIKAEYLYFGHFTGKDGSNTILLDQQNSNGKLLVELIAYDFKKKVFNFYELIGGFPNPKWFYRGDTIDALKDNKGLKIQGIKATRSKMRCSACHNTGGPIMKEIDYPHSDWWTEKNLINFGNAKLSNELNEYIEDFVDASKFSLNVKNGLKLLKKNSIGEALNIKEQLRPLFCTIEINLKSDKEMYLNPKHELMELSSEVFVNPLLIEPVIMNMNKAKYSVSLLKFKSEFPESGDLDAQFGFHAPVKSYTDILAIKNLIKNKVVDEEFALDILSVDFKNPLFSKKRCALLSEINNETHWKSKFIKKLEAKEDQISVALLENLLVSNKEKHKLIAIDYITKKELSWKSQNGVNDEVWKLNLLRNSVYNDEISKNPRGQILEPGFRVIFPTFK